MKKDIAKIHNTSIRFIKSEKAGNLYFYNVVDCHKAMCREVYKVYKAAPNEWEKYINSEARSTAM